MVFMMSTFLCFSQTATISTDKAVKNITLVKADTLKAGDTTVSVQKLSTLPAIELANHVFNLDSIIAAERKLLQAMNDSILALKLKAPAKPVAGSKPIRWVIYIIGCATIVLLFILSKFKWLSNIPVPIIQRIVSKTSKFMLSIQIPCIILAFIIPILLGLGVFGSDMKELMSYLFIAVSAIGGFIFTTTKSAKILKIKPEEVQ